MSPPISRDILDLHKEQHRGGEAKGQLLYPHLESQGMVTMEEQIEENHIGMKWTTGNLAYPAKFTKDWKPTLMKWTFVVWTSFCERPFNFH